MARPTLTTIDQGLEGWDAFVQADFDLLTGAPFPIYENAALTESTIVATFPPASYDRCLVWVNHSVYGYTLYRCDGTNWKSFDPQRRLERNVTTTTTLTTAEVADIITVSGTLPYTINLPTATSMHGRTMVFKTLVAGTVTLDGSGAETIDGAATATITSQYGVLRLFCNGTTWYAV
jgi:hypothetical protein